jgi:exodeoxyribonuclease V alpha subunit
MTGLEIPSIDGKVPALDDCRIELTVSHRFSSHGGISRLADAVRHGKGNEAWAALTTGGGEIRFVELPTKASQGLHAVLDLAASGYRIFRAATTPEAAIDALFRFRVLCGHRAGPLGVESINTSLVESTRPGQSRSGVSAIPILITENAPELSLFNGDVGVLWRSSDPAEGRQAFVRTATGELRSFSISRLPAHEAAFAMTVHKSQGSEVEQVVFVLPSPNSPLLTRELLYTAITRSRSACTLLGTKDAFLQACGRKSRRSSGLALGLANVGRP